MSEQQHLIKRQVLELEVDRAEDARWLQTELSRIYRQRIVPLIDRYCTELSTPDELHRIDTLDLDLGAVDLYHLEDDLVAKVRAQLRPQLTAQLRAQEHLATGQGASLKTTSQLELLSLFAQTGSLPWWADASHPHLLDDSLQHLMQHAPGALRRLMRELAQDERPHQRLVQHLNDAHLAALFDLLAPTLQASLASFARELVAVLPGATVLAGRQQAWLRHRVGYSILRVASLQGEGDAAPAPFYREVLLHVAAALGVRYATLIADMYQVTQRQGAQASEASFRSPLRETVETLHQERLGEAAKGAEDLTPRAEPIPVAEDALAELWAALRAVAARLPAPRQAQVRSTLTRLQRQAVDSDTLDTLITLLQPLLTQHLLPPDRVRQGLAEMRQAAAGGLSPEGVSALTEMLQAAVRVDVPAQSQAEELQAAARVDAPAQSQAEDRRIDLSFSDADELYIGNAGLVILWPFLSHFFAHLDLLHDTQFKDAAATQRAVGLLQHVASEETLPPEYVLPLNKVLCGMDLTEVFDFGAPVSEAEAEECDNLLTAVIAQAPILRDMSVPGFRGTFLLRQGILSSRDGAWLLRVERETYDVVLDRFPWSLEWVKLPWMDTLLRVEW